jgi:bifunctional DNA-binding transcriptional regulator/antitoxin component of YhaV-PrlF toxin-antitoxin module
MANITIGADGHVALPKEVGERYHLKPETPLRLIETRSGILLVPVIDEPMSDELRDELADLQALNLTS